MSETTESLPPPEPLSNRPSPPSPKARYLQEEALTQECKDLLSTLPKDKGWVCSHLYQYQGFWHTPRQLEGVLTTQAHFQARHSDILLVTTPKSGTTWLKALLYSLVNRTHHSPSDQNPNHPLLSHNPHDLVPFLELKVYVENQVPDLSTLPSPRLFATHLPLESLPGSVHESGCKIVYLCRDPKDTIISLWHFTNKLRPAMSGELTLEEALERFCRGVSLCGPFWDHVLGYWKASLKRPDRVLFLKFEDLKGETTYWMKKLGVFLDCPFSLEEEKDGVLQETLRLCGFASLSNLEVNRCGKLTSGEEKKAFFRRGEVGDSANYLSKEMMEKIDRISEEKLLDLGLKF